MDSRQPPLERLPLHVVSNVLTQLETPEQLGIAVRSHRIFRDALKDDPAIPYRLVRNRIPASVLPFAVAVLESTQNSKSDGPSDDDIHDILERLEVNTLSTEVTLDHYSPPELAFLTRTYAAVEALSQVMAEEQLPLFVDRLSLDHRGIKITEQEAVRLGRAFLRYQLMCNLFCAHFVGMRRSPRLSWYFFHFLGAKDPEKRFFTAFSPWVNEQLICVHEYLERKIEDAFVDVAAHDVEWAGLQEFELHGFRRGGSMFTEWFVTQGLPFLAAVLRAKTFNERHALFESLPWRKGRNSVNPEQILRSYHKKRSEFYGIPDFSTLSLDQPPVDGLPWTLDREIDSMSSSPFRLWYMAHAVPVPDYRVPRDPGSPIASRFSPGPKVDINSLRQCGYVMWDCDLAETAPEDLPLEALSFEEAFWTSQVNKLSAWQSLRNREKEHFTLRWKRDIRLRRGTGYWPTEGFDFSRIRGLTEDDKRELMEQWRPEFEAWEEKHQPGSPAAPPEPEPIPAGAILRRIPMPRCAWVPSDSGLNERLV